MKKIKEGQLRIRHIPQVPGKSFRVEVDSPKEAKKILEILAIYDLFQLEYHIKPSYSNAQGLEVYKNGGWTEWYDEKGNNMDNTGLPKSYRLRTGKFFGNYVLSAIL